MKRPGLWDKMLALTICGRCGWEFYGPVGKGRRLLEAHICKAAA